MLHVPTLLARRARAKALRVLAHLCKGRAHVNLARPVLPLEVHARLMAARHDGDGVLVRREWA